MTSSPQHPEPVAAIDGRTDESAPPGTRPLDTGGSETTAPRVIPEVVEAACRFAAARQRPAAFFLLAEGNPADGTEDIPITRRNVGSLAAAFGNDAHLDGLDLVIQSSGGDIHAAYQMMAFIRAHLTPGAELVACVPRRAQSSATLLCLGGDRIFIDELGTLGPLDAQIRVGLTEAGTPDYSSALHLLKGLHRLQEFSVDTLVEAAATLYDNRVRRNEDILHFAIEFSRGITAPLFERIESHKAGYWDQMLRTGEAYGRRLLDSGQLIVVPPDRDRRAHIDEVLHRLVFEYPSHEYVLDKGELRDTLHLRAEAFPAATLPAVRALARYSTDTLVMLVYPPNHDPGTMADARPSALSDWTTPITGETPTLSWTPAPGERFLMRVGLYRPLKPSRNPWRTGTPRSIDPGPAEQYFAYRPSWTAPRDDDSDSPE
jgi:hypothetical protein